VEHAQARPAKPFTAADAPVVLGRRRESLESRHNLRAALLFQPFEATEFL
jgi:hypothetical protein